MFMQRESGDASQTLQFKEMIDNHFGNKKTASSNPAASKLMQKQADTMVTAQTDASKRLLEAQTSGTKAVSEVRSNTTESETWTLPVAPKRGASLTDPQRRVGDWRKSMIKNGEPSGWKGHEEFVWWLCDWLKPKLMVELGVDWGYSFLCLGTSKQGRVIGIDHFQGDEMTGQRDTHVHVSFITQAMKLGKCNVEIRNAKFADQAKSWADGPIQLLHIDGHPKECQADFNAWLPHLDASTFSVLLLHNATVWPQVKAVYEQGPRCFYKCLFPDAGGLGVLSKNSALIDAICQEFSLRKE